MEMPSYTIGAASSGTIAEPGAAMRRTGFVFPLLFLVAHPLSIALAGNRAQIFSLAFLVLAPLLAGAACLYRARHDRAAAGWTALGFAMLLWAGGMGANMVSALLLQNSSGITSLSMLLFVLYGVPILFAVASPDQESWHVRLVDGALALTLGYLFFVYTLEFASLSGASATGVLNLRLMFDIENLFIAAFALIRFLACSDPPRRAFFRAAALFAWAYLAAAFYINHFQMESDYGSLVDPLIDLPFLLLIALALRHHAPDTRPTAVVRTLERTVRAGSPLMLPATLLMVSALLVPDHPALAIAGFVAATLGYGLRNILVQMRGFDERDALERLSRLDALTGLSNRREFDERLRLEWARAARAGTGLALLMIDIDHFKLLNDSFGHPVGDQRLRAVAQALAGCAMRGSDMVARFGGEEFAVILPSTDPSEAAVLAERMRMAIEQLDLASPAPGGRVTVSIGIGHIGKLRGDAAERLLAAADAALYDAKQGGRNRVMARRAGPAILATVNGHDADVSASRSSTRLTGGPAARG